MVDEIEFRDEVDEYNAGQSLSINEIILRHVRKISDLSCREFTGGFWEKKPVRTANGVMFSEYWHDDIREAYCNAVDFLIDIVYPKGDKKLKEYLKDFENYKEDIEKKDDDESEKLDVDKKIKLKRQTFRQINLMFERTNFWATGGVSNE